MDKPLTSAQIEEAYVEHVSKIRPITYEYFLLWKDHAPLSAKLAVFKELVAEMAQENNGAGIQAVLNLAKEWQLQESSEQVKQLKLYAALFHAVNHGQYEATKCLLESRLINLKSNPNNLLHIVCFGRWHEKEENTIDVITRMLELGANINKKDKQDQTPLNIACATHEAERAPRLVQEFLIANGAQKTETEAKPSTQGPSAGTQASRPPSDWGHPLHEPIRGDFFQQEQRPLDPALYRSLIKALEYIMGDQG